MTTDWVTPARLQREWVLCAIAAAASRFIPVPLLDDVVKERATRTAIARTWQAHGRPPAPRVVATLTGDSTGLIAGLARSAALLPVTLVLYPWRKAVRLVTSVHGVSGDLVGVLLLARSVDRCLASDWFTGSDPAVLEQQARLVRRAHDQAVSGVDLRVIEYAVGAGLRQVKGLSHQAELLARRSFGRSKTGPPAGEIDATENIGAIGSTEGAPVPAEVEAGVREVQAVLARPEIAALLATLDARFDAALSVSAGRWTRP